LGELTGAYDKGKEQAMELNGQMKENILERDEARANWVAEVVALGVNNGLISGDSKYIKQLSNFALDGDIPVLNVNPITGLGTIDEKLNRKLKSDFDVLDAMVKHDGNNYIKIGSTNGPDNNIGKSSGFFKVKEKKLKNKPE
jgi:hypothetical protein